MEKYKSDRTNYGKTEEEKRLYKVIDCLLEDNKKLLDFKIQIKDSIERNVARDLNDDEILMAVETITFDRALAEDQKIEDGDISLEDWRKKQNKLFRLGVNPYNV